MVNVTSANCGKLVLDDVAKKLATCEGDLEEAEERADIAEDKIIELEEELRVVANNLKSLEVDMIEYILY